MLSWRSNFRNWGSQIFIIFNFTLGPICPYIYTDLYVYQFSSLQHFWKYFRSLNRVLVRRGNQIKYNFEQAWKFNIIKSWGGFLWTNQYFVLCIVKNIVWKTAIKNIRKKVLINRPNWRQLKSVNQLIAKRVVSTRRILSSFIHIV